MDIQKINVSNMIGARGNEVVNQFEIRVGNATYFQSYRSIIAVKQAGTVTLDEYYWNYSTTTGKYRNIFLNEDRKTTEAKIKSGEYKLANLN